MKSILQAVAVIAVIAIVGCNAPERKIPAGVPSDALWVRGNGKGHFISCGYGRGREEIPCGVYDDTTGSVEAEGKFVLTGIARDTSPASFKFVSFDGKRIYLNDGSVLNPMTDAEAPSAETPSTQNQPSPAPESQPATTTGSASPSN